MVGILLWGVVLMALALFLSVLLVTPVVLAWNYVARKIQRRKELKVLR